MKSSISAIILTKNEEKNIVDCLDSLSFCDEIIVVDDESSDRTVEVANSYKHEKMITLTHTSKDNFSEQRNFALKKCTSDWVLFIDADERVTPALRDEIVKTTDLPENDIVGYYVRRIDNIWEKELKYGETGNIELLRLAKRDAGKWRGKVHEVWEIKGKTQKLKNPLLHYPHKSINEFLKKINYYTTIRAEVLYEEGKKVNTVGIMLYPLGKFIVNYLLKYGFRDGISGFIHATLMSFHSFMVRGKLWLLWKKR